MWWNTPDAWLVDNDLANTLFRLGGCLFAWINLMSLKPFTLFSTSILALAFIELNALGLLGLKVLMKNFYYLYVFGLSEYCLQYFKHFFYYDFNDLLMQLQVFKFCFNSFKCLFLIEFFSTIVYIRLAIRWIRWIINDGSLMMDH